MSVFRLLLVPVARAAMYAYRLPLLLWTAT